MTTFSDVFVNCPLLYKSLLDNDSASHIFLLGLCNTTCDVVEFLIVELLLKYLVL